MNLDQDFFQVSKLSEDQKKVFTRNGTLFSPNSVEDQKKKKVFTRNGTHFLSADLRSDAHQSQIFGGDVDEDHTQIVGGVGGYTAKLLEGIYPPIVSAPLPVSTNKTHKFRPNLVPNFGEDLFWVFT